MVVWNNIKCWKKKKKEINIRFHTCAVFLFFLYFRSYVCSVSEACLFETTWRGNKNRCQRYNTSFYWKYGSVWLWWYLKFNRNGRIVNLCVFCYAFHPTLTVARAYEHSFTFSTSHDSKKNIQIILVIMRVYYVVTLWGVFVFYYFLSFFSMQWLIINIILILVLEWRKWGQ